MTGPRMILVPQALLTALALMHCECRTPWSAPHERACPVGQAEALLPPLREAS